MQFNDSVVFDTGFSSNAQIQLNDGGTIAGSPLVVHSDALYCKFVVLIYVHCRR